MYYAIYNNAKEQFLSAGYESIIQFEDYEAAWFSETLWSENGDDIGMINLMAFENLEDAQEAKRVLEKTSWDNLEIVALEHAWVFRIAHGVVVPQGNKVEEV